MYWYISFLRPPPISVSLSTAEIIITPQVANDLRTELCLDPTEITFTWQLVNLQASLGVKGSSSAQYDVAYATPPKKLTTFQPPSSTYKAIPVPLPPLKPGQSWRLGLFPPSPASAETSSQQRLSDLTSERPNVLGVWSEPILIAPVGPGTGAGSSDQARKRAKLESNTSKTQGKSRNGGQELDAIGKGKGKGKDEGPKQTRIQREWTLDSTVGDEGHQAETLSDDTPRERPGAVLQRGGRLRIIEQTSFDLDKKVWDSGLALSSWLYKSLTRTPDAKEIVEGRSSIGLSSCPNETDSARLIRPILDLLRGETPGKELNILEIGSGTGLVSIALGLAMRHHPTYQDRVTITATDLESAMELMRENINLNGLQQPSTLPVVESHQDLSPIEGSDVPTDSSENAGPQLVDVHVQAKVLDWDEELPDWVEHSPPDLVIAADVTYNTASFPSLLKTLTSLLSHARAPKLLLAYKERDPGERELWGLLEQRGVMLELVGKIRGAEEDGQVEIYVGGSK